MSVATRLRRIALGSQGLLKADAFGRGKQATLRAIEQLGYVQIDKISVVERAHHHVLWSRVSNYQSTFLQQLVEERQIFEYWFHAASWLPMSDYRFALPRMSNSNGERNWFKCCDKKLLKYIVQRIHAEGALKARDFEDKGHTHSGWWDWKPAKQALEQLFIQGELMVSRREGFQKVYDLPERVLPDWVDTRMPSLDEYASHLIDSSLRAHGFATLKMMSYLRRGNKLRNAIREQLQCRQENAEVIALKTVNSIMVYLKPDLLEARSPVISSTVRILSPFDNAVIHRQRLKDFFDFNYQLECYVPQKKRQYGYFSLPLLYRDRLVGRMDCKAHRSSSLLEIKSLFVEQRSDDTFYNALADAIVSFAEFNNCAEISISSQWMNENLKRLQSIMFSSRF